MCSSAPIIVSQDLELLGVESEAISVRKIKQPTASASLRQRLHDWMHGLKQTLMAELVSLGLPKERF